MQTAQDLAALEGQGAFIGRHIGPDAHDCAQMLIVIGAANIDEHIARTLSGSLRADKKPDLPDPLEGRDAADL